ncbi:MAG: U32 family peptidase [Mycoplasmataceae bacterium]|nr:U32 family peptidase [Mycoplasmataceae bacterium]
MDLVINPASYDNAIELIKLGVPYIYVGIDHYSICANCILNLSQLHALAKIKKNTKILVSLNRFFFEPEIKQLEILLQNIKSMPVDGIIFGDFAIVQIAKEINFQTKLIYRPYTLVTNYGQFAFYQQNQINCAILANELNAKEVMTIAQNKGQMQIGLQVAGHALTMYSRWHLISNFTQTQKQPLDLTNRKLFLKEPSRQQPSVIYEDEHGTYILTNYDLLLIDEITELKANGVDFIIVDSFLHDANWTNYLAISFLNKINNEVFTLDTSKFPNPISKGFYKGGRKNLFYLPSTD